MVRLDGGLDCGRLATKLRVTKGQSRVCEQREGRKQRLGVSQEQAMTLLAYARQGSASESYATHQVHEIAGRLAKGQTRGERGVGAGACSERRV